MAEPQPSQPFANRYTLTEQSNNLLKQSTSTMYDLCPINLLSLAMALYTIKTHDSELRGQEEAAIIRETKITRSLSELFTRKTANKIANALVKLP